MSFAGMRPELILRTASVAEEKMRNENFALREVIADPSMFEEIVGSSEPLRRVLTQVAKVAQTDSTVLILGETGTGKELIAGAIHKRSQPLLPCVHSGELCGDSVFADRFRALRARKRRLYGSLAAALGEV